MKTGSGLLKHVKVDGYSYIIVQYFKTFILIYRFINK